MAVLRRGTCGERWMHEGVILHEMLVSSKHPSHALKSHRPHVLDGSSLRRNQ